jgi:hypothetical protein
MSTNKHEWLAFVLGAGLVLALWWLTGCATMQTMTGPVQLQEDLVCTR